MAELAEVFEIDDAETFEMLLDPIRWELLERLYEPATVSELAGAMDVPRTRLYHHVRLLEEAGAIRIIETRRRGAIPEKVYRLTAKNYTPSARLMAEYPPRRAAAATVDALLATTRADVLRSVTDGRFDAKRDAQREAAMMTRHVVALSTERRKRFVAELKELLARYESNDPDGEPVAVTLLVYPSSRSVQ